MSAKTHAMRAQIELRKLIWNGQLEGGTRLYEVPLAELLNISRTPVREALSRLTEEGLLERGSSGGYVVRSFSFADVIDSIELRGVLEGTAARLAAERGVSETRMAAIRDVLRRLDACFGPSVDDTDIDAYSDLNSEFHAALAGLSGSKVLQREIERVTRLPFASPSAFLPDVARIEAFRRSLIVGQDQHSAIVEAIAAREGARAEAVAREHTRAARHNLEHIFSNDQRLISLVPGLALIVD